MICKLASYDTAPSIFLPTIFILTASKRNIASHSTAADQFTFEYLTIRKSYRRLVSYFSQETEEICDALFEKGYITPPVRDYVRIETIQPRQKARKLADALIDMVGQKSSVFYGFLGILKNEGPSTDNIVQQLEEGFAAERAVLVDSGQTSEEETTLHTYSSIPRRGEYIISSPSLNTNLAQHQYVDNHAWEWLSRDGQVFRCMWRFCGQNLPTFKLRLFTGSNQWTSFFYIEI